MKFIETGDPDILRTRRGGGIAMIFGIVFLLTGILIISLSFDVYEKQLKRSVSKKSQSKDIKLA